MKTFLKLKSLVNESWNPTVYNETRKSIKSTGGRWNAMMTKDGLKVKLWRFRIWFKRQNNKKAFIA